MGMHTSLQRSTRVVPLLSKAWIPTGGIAPKHHEDGHDKLIRAGYLRQSHAGVFHLLPLGRRVQGKLEGLVAQHMEDVLAASRVSLSTISSAALWEKSGRLANAATELFSFMDRKDVPYLLSPTHEEEITTLVSRNVKSYKQLPLRLYQITRKYRDEFRPRHGLLRGREFTMKDLYTFDLSISDALKTYHQVQSAYASIFAELKLPIIVAQASSGDMGGDLSHEYHLATSLGEDHVVSCDSCSYVANDELAETVTSEQCAPKTRVLVWRGISKDRSTLVNVWYPETTTTDDQDAFRTHGHNAVNTHAAKTVVPDLDASVENPLPFWAAALKESKTNACRLVNLVDGRLPTSISDSLRAFDSTNSKDLPVWPAGLGQPPKAVSAVVHDREGRPLNFIRIRDGDKCPKCSSGKLRVQRAIELGHTFYLGTRYSEPLDAKVTIPWPAGDKEPSSQVVPMQMGCHGIGISRIMGAVANHLADTRGLNWPVVIAPYTCVIVPRTEEEHADAVLACQSLTDPADEAEYGPLDLILDDRKDSLPRRLTDVDLIGIPIVVVLGREWRASKRLEVQCRRPKYKEFVPIDALARTVRDLLQQL